MGSSIVRPVPRIGQCRHCATLAYWCSVLSVTHLLSSDVPPLWDVVGVGLNLGYRRRALLRGTRSEQSTVHQNGFICLYVYISLILRRGIRSWMDCLGSGNIRFSPVRSPPRKFDPQLQEERCRAERERHPIWHQSVIKPLDTDAFQTVGCCLIIFSAFKYSQYLILFDVTLTLVSCVTTMSIDHKIVQSCASNVVWALTRWSCVAMSVRPQLWPSH